MSEENWGVTKIQCDLEGVGLGRECDRRLHLDGPSSLPTADADHLRNHSVICVA